MQPIKSRYKVEAKYTVFDYFSVPHNIEEVHSWYIKNRQLWIKVKHNSDWEQFVSDGDKLGYNHDEMKYPLEEGICCGELNSKGNYVFGEYLVMK